MPVREARPRVKNRHGGAPKGERPASWDARRLASAWRTALCARPTGAAAPERLSALRPPSFGVSEAKLQTSGAENAPRERDGLFDIVRWELPKTVRRRTASSVCPRPPHPEERACGSAAANQVVRARVSKDGAAIPLMLRDASQRSRAVDAFELAWAAMLLSMRASAGSAEPTCGCGRRSPAPFHCFGIVIYNGKRNSNVSSRKRALRRASLGGVASRAVRCHGGAQGAANPSYVNFAMAGLPPRGDNARAALLRPTASMQPGTNHVYQKSND